MKGTILAVTLLSSDSPTFQGNIHPPSSRLKSKPSQKPANAGGNLSNGHDMSASLRLYGVTMRKVVFLRHAVRTSNAKRIYIFLLRFIQDASYSDYVASDGNQVFWHTELFESNSTHPDSNSPITSHFHTSIILNHPSSQQYLIPYLQIPSNTICTELSATYIFHSTEILQHDMTLNMCNDDIQKCVYLCYTEIYLKWKNYSHLSVCLN
jgi:hypothetical protein